MQLLSIILQSKKGENLVIVTSHNFRLSDAIKYSTIIYEHILDTYSTHNNSLENGLKIERSFALANELYCVTTVTKEYILDILVDKNDLLLGYDATRKLTDYFKNTFKVENAQKKIVELFSLFEQFLYCRQLVPAEPMLIAKATPVSRKKLADYEIFNKFNFINSDIDKKILADNVIRFNRNKTTVNTLAQKKKVANKRFSIKTFEQLEIFEINQNKENYLKKYRKFITKNAFINRVTKAIHHQAENQEPIIIQEQPGENTPVKIQEASTALQEPSLVQLSSKEQKLEQIMKTPVLTENKSQPKHPIKQIQKVTAKSQEILIKQQIRIQVPKSEIKKESISKEETRKMQIVNPEQKQLDQRKNCLKINERLQIVQHDGKVKEVNQCGQISVEANKKENFYLNLVSDIWYNKRILVTRPTPNSYKISPISESRIMVEINEENKMKGIIDYVLKKQTFAQEKIPLIFVYNHETKRIGNDVVIEFIFKYKVNQKWKGALYDIDIQIHLDPNFMFSDCKTLPIANSLRGRMVNWKAKQLGEDAKGKLSLSFYDSNKTPQNIIKEIRLSMKCEKSLIPELDASYEIGNYRERAKKNLIIEYKIQAN